MSIRTLLDNSSENTELTNSLKNNEEFIYAHLIKFERPGLSTSTGIATNKAESFSYITDASHNIEFDDGSTDNSLPPLSNGSQTYVANKVLKVGNISETTKAKASNMTLTLSGNALGTMVTAYFTFTSNTATADIDLIDAGFAEGDTLVFEKIGATNDSVVVRIDKFSNDNKTISITPITGSLIGNGTAVEYNASLVSEELRGLFLDKRQSDYGTYINRKVSIYKAHINPDTGDFIGSPWLIFNGIISSANVKDNVLGKSTVNWNLTSHWGDFLRVNGRLTQDSSHRALNSAGVPDRDALKNIFYAGDLGFMHSERGISLLATYQGTETRYKTKKRGGLAGLMGGVRLVEYQETVDREVDLRFDLTAKYLPVIYGVQKTKGIPVFADAGYNDPNSVYIAQAFCEGPIHGIYDFHIEDQPLVCVNSVDFSGRSTSDSSIACFGRADKGDVLSSVSNYLGTNFIEEMEDLEYDFDMYGEAEKWAYYQELVQDQIEFAKNAADGRGLIHEYSYVINNPMTISTVVHTGKPFQKADSLLASKAASNGFMLQNQLFQDSSIKYWGPSHRLLDTAYCSMKFTIGEGETTIPDIEAVVKGKLVNCHNYDFSYVGNGNQEDFLLGSSVTLHKTSDNSQLGSSVQIIDKWSYYLPNGDLTYRFRFSDNPQPSNESFYMKNSSGDIWYFDSEDTNLETNGTVQTSPVATISSVSSSTYNRANLVLNNPSTEFETIAGISDKFFVSLNGSSDNTLYYGVSYDSGINRLIVHEKSNNNSIYTSGAGGVVSFANAIKLDSNASTSDDFYNGAAIIVSEFDSEGNRTDHVREIVDYVGTYKIAFLDEALPFTPSSSTKYNIKSTYGEDLRVTINPAMQLLDYLTSERYGKGLDINTEIDLESFKKAARDCDTRSNVTIQVVTSSLSSTPSIGSVYELTDSESGTIFQGTVKSTTVNTYNSASYTEIEFEDVIGKLAYVWSDWRPFKKGSYFYHNGKVKQVTSAGTVSVGVRDSASGTSITLTKVSGSGDSTIAATTTDGTTSGYNRNPIVKKFTSATAGFTSPGYSLYDSDDCPYWVYLGWDYSEQRYVTRHQMNVTIDTSIPVFDNINSMLEQFNGVLSYSNGKYSLKVKQKAPSAFDSVELIAEDDIIGSINVDDKGQKDTFNSLTSQIVDPQNKFGGRAVTFTNSTYLKEDKGISRQGNYSLPGVTNYFNARMNIKQYLDSSRYGLKVSFKIGQQGMLLSAGEIIKLSYSRFGWDEKYFRIDSLSFSPDGLTSIVALEHNEEAFLIDNLKTAGSESVADGGNTNSTFKAPDEPRSLSATQDVEGSVQLTWDNSLTFAIGRSTTQIWRADTNSITDNSFSLIAEVTGPTTYVDVIDTASTVKKYYWVRHSTTNTKGEKVFSGYFPTGGIGVEGTAIGTAGANALDLYLVNTAHALSVDPEGEVDYSNSGTLVRVYQGTEELVYAANFDSLSDEEKEGKYKISTTGSSITASTTFTAEDGGNGVVVGNHSNMTASNALVDIEATGKRSGTGDNFVLTRSQSLSKAVSGSVGVDARTVKLTSATYVITYDAEGSTASPSANQTLTASALNFVSPEYRFKVGSDEWSEWSTTSTSSFTPPAAYFSSAINMQVEVREAAETTLVVSDSITVYSVKPGIEGENAITTIVTNEAHTLPTTEADVVTYTGSGTKIRVFEGSTELTYDGVGTTNSTWTVTVSETGISAGSRTAEEGGKGLIVADHTSMTSTNASITFTITGKRADGTSLGTVERTQSLSKSQDGATGYSTGVIILYQQGTEVPADPTDTLTYSVTSNSFTGTNDSTDLNGWTLLKPEVTLGNNLYAIQYIYSNQATSFDITATQWSAPVVVGSNTRGENGPDGLRTVQGYLYFEDTSDTSAEGYVPPLAPDGNTYAFNTGLVSGDDIDDTEGATDVWRNLQNPINNSSSFYTVRYYGTEAAADSANISVTYSNVVPYTSFTGVVTFSEGTEGLGTFQKDGIDITTIDGGNITTGSIQATKLSIGDVGITSGETDALKLYDDCLKIFNTGVVRVKLGNLGNTEDES